MPIKIEEISEIKFSKNYYISEIEEQKLPEKSEIKSCTTQFSKIINDWLNDSKKGLVHLAKRTG